jgi:hypothetical protein
MCPSLNSRSGEDAIKLIDGLERQIAAVRAVLNGGGYQEITVRGAVCFTKADLPFLRTQTFRDHLLLYRRALAKRLNADGPLRSASIEQLARHLATLLPRHGQTPAGAVGRSSVNDKPSRKIRHALVVYFRTA